MLANTITPPSPSVQGELRRLCLDTTGATLAAELVVASDNAAPATARSFAAAGAIIP